MNSKPLDLNAPDHLYYDMLITNFQSNGQPIIAKSKDSRSTPLIKNTSEYDMSIVRFSLDTTSIPVFAPIIQAGPTQSDPNLTIYSITAEYTDTVTNITYNYQQYLEFSPQNKTVDVPIPPSQNAPSYLQNNSNGYYNVYNYNYLIFLVNKTFTAVLAELGSLVTLPTADVPVMSYDNLNQVANITINNLYFGTNEFGKINIYFNQSLYQLFNSFQYYVEDLSDINGRNYQLSVNWNPADKQGDTTILTQEYSTIANWCPVIAIGFATNLIPVISNQYSNPAVYVNNTLQNNTSTTDYFNIITDIVAENLQYRPFLVYNPTAEYRYIALKPNSTIVSVDIQLYFQNKLGQYFPIELLSGGSASIKFLFRKKQ